MSYFVFSLRPQFSSLGTRMHSCDTLIRVSWPRLATLAFTHLCTISDATVCDDARSLGVPACDGGLSEWSACVDGKVVSIGWDWLRLRNGALAPYRLVAPRSNLMVTEPAGYDMAPAQIEVCLWKVVEQLEWHHHAPPYGPY